MKTVSENVSDKMCNKKGTRKFLQTLQPSGGDKENLVGTGRLREKNTDTKILKPQIKTDTEAKSKENKSIIAKVNPSLYKKLIIEDLTSTDGPSEKYWEVIAERRRKALEDVLEQNRKLHSVIMALEEENVSCKKLLEQTTDLVNTLKEVLNDEEDNELILEKEPANNESDIKNVLIDSKHSTDDNDNSNIDSK